MTDYAKTDGNLIKISNGEVTNIADPKFFNEIRVDIRGKQYRIPAIGHELDYNPVVALFAVIVKLNERVNELESVLKGDTP